MEDPSKAKAFDQLHKEGPKWGRQHAGAKELASGYTRGSYRMELWPRFACTLKAYSR